MNYRPRTAGGLLMALMLACAVQDWSAPPPFFLLAIATSFLWPHLALFRAGRARDARLAERANVLADCFFFGLGASMLAFRLWPAAAISVMLLINTLLSGGPRFLLLGMVPMAVGALTGAAMVGFSIQPETEPVLIAISMGAIVFYVGLIGVTAHRLRLRQRETRAALEEEERRSNELLLNVLPHAVVPRLKAGERPIADQFADVTVIFSDIVEFTPLSERLGPGRMVSLLNELFGRFDLAAKTFGVEKIETTGDGYLAAGGAPNPLDRHPEAVARFALALVDVARTVEISGTEHVRIRVGIHTGPIFAGVIGESRFHYKIFGETVNTASRIQGHSEPGRILVSDATFKRLGGTFNFEERGIVELKGHGPMRTYWLLDRAAKKKGANLAS